MNRFRVESGQTEQFRALVEAAVAHYRSIEGALDVQLVRNLDEEDLWALVSSWRDVGSYRRALGGNQSKFVLMPLMAFAVDEPSAYGDPDEVGLNLPREMY